MKIQLTKAQHDKMEKTLGMGCLCWAFLTEKGKKEVLNVMNSEYFEGDLADAKAGCFDGTFKD